MEWRNYLLIKYEDWPIPLWEKLDELRNFKAYKVFQESKRQRRAKERRKSATTEVVTLSSCDEDEGGVESRRIIETSVFNKEVHPLTLHLTTLTGARSTRLYEVGIASFLNKGEQDRESSFHEKVKYADMQLQYMGAGRERLREKSGLSKSDFSGEAGQNMLEGLYKYQESKLIERVYAWLHKNVRSGEPLWISLNSDSLALLRHKIKRYQPENEDWRWVVGGFTTWNRIQKLFRLVDPDGGQDTRSMKEFQEQDLKLDHVSGTARDVALNMVTTIEQVAKAFLE